MIVSILVAMDESRAIGHKGGLPWRLSSDLKRFRELTMGHHIVVGRKTFESIGRPLPGRQTIVVTLKDDYKPEGCLVARSLPEAIALAEARGETELFICGGAQIYAESLAGADRIYLTLVHTRVEADTYFPEYDESGWSEKEATRHEADEKNEHSFTFKRLDRKHDRDRN